MRSGDAWAAPQFPELAGGGRAAARRFLQDSGSWTPSTCSYYGMDPGGDCVPARSAVVYLVTGVAGMALLLTLTVFFICCLCLRKRRRDEAEAAFLRWQQAQAVQYPTMGAAYYVSTPYTEGHRDSGGSRDPTVALGPVDSKNPSVCVIMAGEEKPTFLAHPIGNGTDMAAPEASAKESATPAAGSKSRG
eukprot:TRINITY_DN1642_c0_g1_i1.p1 TRINITY_DN1642_c0_g1~~TRINITY_DN1642_c0_g1_i1.p1  ORF type:complete len:190 (+),score=0.88 TRINITY_DN1642_c0_g1_i1:157-726(+)